MCIYIYIYVACCGIVVICHNAIYHNRRDAASCRCGKADVCTPPPPGVIL